MSQIAYSKHLYDCEAEDIDVYFEYNNSVVFSTDEKSVVGDGVRLIKCKKLAVISKCEMEQYLAPMEVQRYCRGDNLVIQGIISFFTGFPLTVYHSNSGSGGLKKPDYKKQDMHLKIADIDYTEDLKILLKKLDDEPNLIITLLDRWRKAIFLKHESCDADLYYDESTLCFFHILEMFGDSINGELKEKLQNNIDAMLYKHFEAYYFSESQIKQMVEQNKKAINSLLIGDYLNLSVKVKYFLDKYSLLDDNVSFFVDSMIKVRNAIAHGRISFQKAFIWPLPPFYSLAKDSYENIEFLFFLTARMISAYIGIECWKMEWNESKRFLMPPQNVILSFFDGSLCIENATLSTGNEHNLTWRTLFNYYVKNPKSTTKEKLEKSVKDAFLETITDKENAPDIFNISLILADSDDKDIKNKAIENIKVIIKENWHGWSNFKDAHTYLEFYSVSTIWYKNFLDTKEYLVLKK